ncbi:hypothetical protein C8F01DRAFT_1160560 [Mycena amicta]|nr:hypothetical protein C8F01DRAFT_1160560 [Mycena amicta]
MLAIDMDLLDRGLPKTLMSTPSVLRSIESLIAALLLPLYDPCPALSVPKLRIIMGFPDELLWEIFIHCMDPHTSTFGADNHLWAIMKVCTRWRAVILNAPQFWPRISFTDWRTTDNQIFSKAAAASRTSKQVKRSGQVPLTLNLMPIPVLTDSDDVLEVLFNASARVESAVLTLDNHLLHRFHKHAGGFPALQKLEVGLIEELGELEKEAAASFFDGLTALEHLHLSNQVEFDWVSALVPLESLWNRLRVCELTECMVDDVLLVLPHFSAGTRLSLIIGRYMRGAPDSLTVVEHCDIQSLSFDRCEDDFIARVLDNITAPSLQRLAIWYFEASPFDTITAMLGRSSAFLTHLALRLPSAGLFRQRDPPAPTVTELLELLNSEYVRGLVDLDLTLASRFAPSTVQLVHALSLAPTELESGPALRLPILPNLRSLALRGYDDEDALWEKRLAAMAETREPVLKSLWLEETLPAVSQRTLEKLHSHGVEFVCSYDMGMW